MLDQQASYIVGFMVDCHAQRRLAIEFILVFVRVRSGLLCP